MRSRAHRGETDMAQSNNVISALHSFTYRVNVQIAGTQATFIPDTGAAVTLLRKDVWDAAQPHLPLCELKPWTGDGLIGAGGTPLQTMGYTNMDLAIAGGKFPSEVIVVDSLMTEGILGVDFLKKHRCNVDLEEGRLTLDNGKFSTALLNKVEDTRQTRDVFVVDNIQITAYSELEIDAVTSQGVGDGGVWLMENKPKRQQTAMVARSLVSPCNNKVVARVLNTTGETIVLYQGTKIAELEKISESCISSIEPDSIESQCSATSPHDISNEKRELLWGAVEESQGDLTEAEKEKFLELLIDFSDIFSTSKADIGRTSRLQHSIDTGDSPPIRQPVRRLPPHRKQEVRTLLQQMKDQDVIQPSCSPWAAPIVLVKKKDSSTRFCIDYRKLNSVTRKDAYPLPRIDDTLDTLVGSHWFSTLDLTSGYWQVEVKDEDRQKTAFCTPEGLFEFKVMPFGLCNAPATFQRLMDLVLAGLQWSHCLVYLDDVIILGRTFLDHLNNLRDIFKRIQDAGLKLKLPKCSFLKKKVEYLGHIVSEDGVLVDPKKIEKVSTWPTPSSTKEVQQFLGLANYYRRFIQDFAKIASPLHKLTERTAQFHWTDACQVAFEELRHRLTSTPVLAFPDFTRPFILDTDASDSSLGAVLSQVNGEGQEQVIAYASRLLSKAERQYCVTRKELLVVVTFTQHFRAYLLNQHFTLRTDHGSLTWLRNMKDPEGQLARWLEKLQEFNFEIVHRPGKKHSNADALLRIPCRQCGRSDEQPAVIEPLAVLAAVLQQAQPGEMRASQLQDPTIGPILTAKESDERPPHDKEKSGNIERRRLLQLWDQLLVRDGILYRQFIGTNGAPNHLQLILPLALRENVLKELHEGAVGGHLGEEKTLSRLKERYYWPGHWTDVRN